MKSTCFVISPFGEPFDEYYEKIYKPAITKADLKPIRADEVYGTNAIIEDIFEQIVNAKLVICEATGKNPNVNYELGVAHALQKPAIIITQSIHDVPFDYRHLRVITYDQSKVNWAEMLQSAVAKTILSVLSNPDRAKVWKPEVVQETIQSNVPEEEIIISYSLDPSEAALRFRNQHVQLMTRGGDVHPGFKSIFLEIYEDIEKIENSISKNEYIQLRRIWHDDKHGHIVIWVDLIYKNDVAPTYNEKKIQDILHDGYGWYANQGTSVNVRIISENIWSDNFFPNSPEYYKNLEF